jgi:hypothetical protein
MPKEMSSPPDTQIPSQFGVLERNGFCFTWRVSLPQPQPSIGWYKKYLKKKHIVASSSRG